MIPASAIIALLSAASVGGGIIQAANGKPMISPEWLKKHFGVAAVGNETMELFNRILSSPFGVDIMSNAASQGSQFESNLRSASAATGLGAGEGGTSGANIFSESAAGGAGQAMARQAKSGMFEAALPIAQSIVGSRLAAYLGQPALQEPTAGQKFGTALGNLGAVGLQNMDWGSLSTPGTKPLALGETKSEEQLAQAQERKVEPIDLMDSAVNANAVQRGGGRFRASLGGFV